MRYTLQEEADSMEADIDKDDGLKPGPGELGGDRLLNTHYVNTVPSSARSRRRVSEHTLCYLGFMPEMEAHTWHNS